MREPQTPVEWLEAVSGAEAMLLIDSARQYGLVTGGPKVNVERCRDLIARGDRLGYRPDKRVVDEIVASMAKE